MTCNNCEHFILDESISEGFGNCKKFNAHNFDTSKSRPVFYNENGCFYDSFVADYSGWKKKQPQMEFEL